MQPAVAGRHGAGRSGGDQRPGSLRLDCFFMPAIPQAFRVLCDEQHRIVLEHFDDLCLLPENTSPIFIEIPKTKQKGIP